MTNVNTPCPNCPFSRSVKPGALGGSPVQKYIGQSVGPFVLPCHCHCNFDDPQWKSKVMETPQCAGAAIFRSNIGVAPLLPDAIHKLPANRETVFASLAEFAEHHLGLPDGFGDSFLQVFSPLSLLRDEMQSQDLVVKGLR